MSTVLSSAPFLDFSHFSHKFKKISDRAPNTVPYGAWIAERDGEILGSIFLVTQSKKVAQLRLFLVEPTARGQGVGARLLQECIRFARESSYEKLSLWTTDAQKKARRLYEQAGFELVKEERYESFGPKAKALTFELALK